VVLFRGRFFLPRWESGGKGTDGDIMAENRDYPFSFGDGDLEAERRDSAPLWISKPSRGKIRVVLQKNLPMRFALHFVEGRPQLCWGRAHCGHCADRRGKKVHYVYPAFDLTRRTPGLLDIPPHAEDSVKAARDARGFVEGMVFEVAKEGGTENGRIVVTALHEILDLQRFGDALDVVELVCRQYGIDRGLVDRTADVP